MVDELTDLSRGAKDDGIATDVKRRGEKITRIFDIYDKKDTRSGERQRPVRKFYWQRVIWQGGTVLAGDFNAHSKQWDPRCQVQWDTTF